jgi:hypothetical protein
MIHFYDNTDPLQTPGDLSMMTEQRDMRPHRREFDKNAYVNDWRSRGEVYGKMEADAVAGLPGVLSEGNAAWCAANYIDDEKGVSNVTD